MTPSEAVYKILSDGFNVNHPDIAAIISNGMERYEKGDYFKFADLVAETRKLVKKTVKDNQRKDSLNNERANQTTN